MWTLDGQFHNVKKDLSFHSSLHEIIYTCVTLPLAVWLTALYSSAGCSCTIIFLSALVFWYILLQYWYYIYIYILCLDCKIFNWWWFSICVGQIQRHIKKMVERSFWLISYCKSGRSCLCLFPRYLLWGAGGGGGSLQWSALYYATFVS